MLWSSSPTAVHNTRPSQRRFNSSVLISFTCSRSFSHAERMEGADDEVLRRAWPDQRLRAFALFGGGLVRERDRRDLPRFIARLQQPRDLVRDHARLAGARTGQHEARPTEVVYRFEL